MEFDEISNRVIGCAIEVHRNLGPGLIESVYRRCLEYELWQAGVAFESEKLVEVRYKQVTLAGPHLRVDLVVEQQLIVELKVVERLLPVHEAQLLTYMKLTGCGIGLLINFESRLIRDGLRRLVL